MAVKARPGEGAFSQKNDVGRGFVTPPGNPRIPPGSRLASPRFGEIRSARYTHGNQDRASQERTRVDYETR